MDQTAWWEAGWDVAGVADLLDGTNVSWTMTIDSSPQTLEVPCANPVPSTDPELGKTLVCSN